MVDSSGRWWELSTERQMHCPAGHHLPFKQRINETGFVRCEHGKAKLPGKLGEVYDLMAGGNIPASNRLAVSLRAQGTTVPATRAEWESLKAASQFGECGLWVFVYAVRGGGMLTAQVSLDEMEEMRELQTPMAMLSYLSIWPTRKAG